MTASLSHIVHLILSKQSATARANFFSWVLVLPAKERFSFKVFSYTMFSAKSVYILVKGKQNNTLHFYHLHKPLFSENVRNQTTFNDCLLLTDSASQITCKFKVKYYCIQV